jgi:hypothetical protein
LILLRALTDLSAGAEVTGEIPLNFDQAINTFAADGNRRIQLMFPY